jgi:hypothetical protein
MSAMETIVISLSLGMPMLFERDHLAPRLDLQKIHKQRTTYQGNKLITARQVWLIMANHIGTPRSTRITIDISKTR